MKNYENPAKAIELRGKKAAAFIAKKRCRDTLLNRIEENGSAFYLEEINNLIVDCLKRGIHTFVLEPISQIEILFVQSLLSYIHGYPDIEWYAFFCFEPDEKQFFDDTEDTIQEIREQMSGSGHYFSIEQISRTSMYRIEISTKKMICFYNYLANTCDEYLICSEPSGDCVLNRALLTREHCNNFYPKLRSSFNELKEKAKYESKNWHYLDAGKKILLTMYPYQNLLEQIKMVYCLCLSSKDMDTFSSAFSKLISLNECMTALIKKFGFIVGLRAKYRELSLSSFLDRRDQRNNSKVVSFHVANGCIHDYHIKYNADICRNSLYRLIESCLKRGKTTFVSGVNSWLHHEFIDILSHFAVDYPDIKFYPFIFYEKLNKNFNPRSFSPHDFIQEGFVFGSHHMYENYLKALIQNSSVCIAYCHYSTIIHAELLAMEKNVEFHNALDDLPLTNRERFSVDNAKHLIDEYLSKTPSWTNEDAYQKVQSVAACIGNAAYVEICKAYVLEYYDLIQRLWPVIRLNAVLDGIKIFYPDVNKDDFIDCI